MAFAHNFAGLLHMITLSSPRAAREAAKCKPLHPPLSSRRARAHATAEPGTAPPLRAPPPRSARLGARAFTPIVISPGLAVGW